MRNRKKSSKEYASQARSEPLTPSAIALGMLVDIAIITIAVFLVYLPSMNGGFILDDDQLLTNNDLIKASDGLYKIWFTTQSQDYWPVTNTSFWLEWRLWGMSPTGYHVTNVILHIIESLLVWIILRKMCIPGAFLAAVIFAVHPVNVESVAWIASRKSLMSMLFFLSSILCYLQFLASARVPLAAKQPPLAALAPSPSSLAPSIWYWLSLAAFVMAMLSKGSVAVLPLALLGIIWWQRHLTWRDILKIAPFFAVAIALTLVNVWFQTHGIDRTIRNAGVADRVLGAGGVVWFYLYKAFLPIDLVFVYPQWHFQTGNPLWWLPLVAAVAVTVTLWLYRESWSRPFLFAWGFFCVGLLPVMGFIDVGYMKHSLVADHYQHIAIIGAITLVAAGFGRWHQCSQSSKTLLLTKQWHTSVPSIIAVGAVGTLAFLTWRQCGLYCNAFTLYQSTLERNPDSWLVHNNLGNEYVHIARPKEAIEHFRRSLDLKSDYFEAHNNLGGILHDMGQFQEAIVHFQRALELQSYHPATHNNLGVALVQMGRSDEAIKHYETALKLRPEYADAHNNLGIILAQTGRPEDAIKHFSTALELQPDYPEVHNNLGNTFLNINRPQEAIEQFQQALALKANYPEAHFNLGNTLRLLGRYQPSIEHYQQALRLRPYYTAAYFNLGLSYAGMGRLSDGFVAVQKALELARSQGQTEQVKQIEEWLNSYRTENKGEED